MNRTPAPIATTYFGLPFEKACAMFLRRFRAGADTYALGREYGCGEEKIIWFLSHGRELERTDAVRPRLADGVSVSA